MSGSTNVIRGLISCFPLLANDTFSGLYAPCLCAEELLEKITREKEQAVLISARKYSESRIVEMGYRVS